MKVNQIVNEHKKGVRAKIYNKKATVKAQGSVPLYGPDKQEAKLTPYKPKKIDETEEIKVGPAPANMQQATDPTGKVIATGPADKIAAVAQAAKDGVDFTPNTDAQQIYAMAIQLILSFLFNFYSKVIFKLIE